MLFRIRRREQQRAPLGGFGISEGEYDRIVARIRAARAASPHPISPGSARRPTFHLVDIAKGTAP